jgi:hypothetical protein
MGSLSLESGRILRRKRQIVLALMRLWPVADLRISFIGGIFFLMNTKNKVERKYN